MTDIAKIAASLTDAQRHYLVEFKERRPGHVTGPRTSTTRTFVDLGLGNIWGVSMIALTDLGLAVQAHLKEPTP